MVAIRRSLISFTPLTKVIVAYASFERNSCSAAAGGQARFALDYSIGIIAAAKIPATIGCTVSREYNGRDKLHYFPLAAPCRRPRALQGASAPGAKAIGPVVLCILSTDKERLP
jgi:hypothetical protein